LEKINIAVVEDEGIVAMDIKKSLQAMGYNIAFVSDTGEKAIIKLKQSKVDLVLLDIILKGGIDGIDTARVIVEDMDIPVIFLTAFEDERTQERIKLLKKCAYLVKPFEDSQLCSAIESALAYSKINH
jgi:CheY-like chemotaxis protein